MGADREIQHESDRGRRRERELVLAPNEYAYVQDSTKGHVNVYVGPNKTSLAGTDALVVFDEKTKRFKEVEHMHQAVSSWRTAPENWYIVLKNPVVDNKHPITGASSQTTPELQVGRKIIVRGPQSFPLWPGQMAKVIKGHTLRSNQYLKVRVYDVEAAMGGWNQALGKPEKEPTPEFTAGQVEIIKGTEVSFYIPPTGVEVVPTCDGEYDRRAVTLQRLEYCILQDENGTKRYVRGEAVVFPRPTQRFVEDDVKNKQCKYKAIELSEIKGIHVKVISPYIDENKVEHKEGEELFIRGKDRIYFPQAEHAIIRYGTSDLIYATAVPPGEGRYVLDRTTGNVNLQKGPSMLMPDPRNQVIARRILSDKQCELLYPDNEEALNYNRSLRNEHKKQMAEVDEAFGAVVASSGVVLDSAQLGDRQTMAGRLSDQYRGRSRAAPKEAFAGDDFNRKTQYTPPRTITLDTKYDGAVRTDIWSGHAIQVVNQDGDREVVEGPAAVLLEYDEFPETLALSTGTPKTNNGKPKLTAFLQVKGNKVTDLVDLTTKDLVNCKLKLKYRVNFEGDSSKWFAVSNYIQLLCDHGNSRLKAVARKHSIHELRQNLTETIRAVILGKKDGDGKRPGLSFEENNMHVFDVEVLDLIIDDPVVNELMISAQHSSVKNEIALQTAEANLCASTRQHEIDRTLARNQAETDKENFVIRGMQEKMEHDVRFASQENEAHLGASRAEIDLKQVEAYAIVNQKRIEVDRLQHSLAIEKDTQRQELSIVLIDKAAESAVKISKAWSPHLVHALEQASSRQLLGELSENFSELGAVEGKGILEIARKFFDFVPINGNLMPVLRNDSDESQE
jgi:major vault protein